MPPGPDSCVIRSRSSSSLLERARQREQAAPDQAFTASSASAAASPAARDADVLTRAIKAMRDDFESLTWEAFWRTAVERLSPVNVAQQLGVSKWVVYQAQSPVLRRLQRDLAGLVE